MRITFAGLILILLSFGAAAETLLRCNETSFPQLAIDKTDNFDVDLPAGQVVSITMRPLLPTLRSVSLFVDPPDGVTRSLPLVIGGTDATVRFVTTAAGRYHVRAGAGTERQSGPYALRVSCGTPNPAASRDCVLQSLVCGQFGRWQLDDDSCDVYMEHSKGVPYAVHAQAGDTITFTMRSNAFHPSLVLKDRWGVTMRESPGANGVAVLAFSFQEPRDVYVYAAAESKEDRGTYELEQSCDTSGCLVPIIVEQPHEVPVALGERASLSLKVDAKQEIAYEWWEAEGTPTLVARTPELTTPPVTRNLTYYAFVTTPCGYILSDMIRVLPGEDRKRARD